MAAQTTRVSRITAQEAKERLDRGEKVYFLDVRGVPDEYQIGGAVCYEPVALLGAERLELGIPKDSLIIPY